MIRSKDSNDASDPPKTPATAGESPADAALAEAEKVVREVFARGGEVTIPESDAQREWRPGAKTRKGYEVRLYTDSEDEAERIREHLTRIGFESDNPWKLHDRWVVRIPSNHAVAWFMSPPAGAKWPRGR